MNDVSLKREAIGCVGVLLGSLFLFGMGLLGAGILVYGLLISNPWLVGLGIGMGTTGLSVGFFGLGFDFDGVNDGLLSSDTGLIGWVSGRGILMLSVSFALMINCLILFFFRPGWQAWVSSFAFPGVMIMMLVISFSRRKPTLDDIV